MHSLAHFALSVLLLGAPFDPAPPRVDDAIAGPRSCERCNCNCRDMERRFERSQETIVRLAEELDALKKRLDVLERKAKKPAEPPNRPRNLAPGVDWEYDQVYELGHDKLYYYRDKEPRKPRVRAFPVLLP